MAALQSEGSWRELGIVGGQLGIVRATVGGQQRTARGIAGDSHGDIWRHPRGQLGTHSRGTVGDSRGKIWNNGKQLGHSQGHISPESPELEGLSS